MDVQDHSTDDRGGPVGALLDVVLAVVVGAVLAWPRVGATQGPPDGRSERAPVQSKQADEPLADAPSGQPKPTAASPAPGDEAFFGPAHRRTMYEQSKLSMTRAVLYNVALPGLGNIYTEQYFEAGLALSLVAFTAVFVSYGLTTDQSQFLWIGAGAAGVAYAGSIATSIYGVYNYNRELREGLKINPAYSHKRWGLPRATTVEVCWQF